MGIDPRFSGRYKSIEMEKEEGARKERIERQEAEWRTRELDEEVITLVGTVISRVRDHQAALAVGQKLLEVDGHAVSTWGE
eukprot:gene19338-4765_t